MARKPDNSPRANAGETGLPETGAGASGPVRVLIVDDSEAVREGLSMLLDSRSYCCVVGAVEDPHSAMRLAREAEPHVVLLDFSMPLVDPLALASQLAVCRPRPAVLMLSALANEHSAARARAAGAVGWVLKDAEPDALFLALLDAAATAEPRWEAPTALAGAVVADGTAASRGTETSEDAGARPDPVAGDAANKLEARTVRALLRALRGDVIGATARDLAGHAVVSPRAADRLLKRLLYRDPALVATVDDGDLTACAYVLTDAGEQELERLERHIAAEGAGMDPPPGRVPCGTR